MVFVRVGALPGRSEACKGVFIDVECNFITSLGARGRDGFGERCVCVLGNKVSRVESCVR